MRSTHALAGWLFAAPALTVIVVFFGLPVLAAFAAWLQEEAAAYREGAPAAGGALPDGAAARDGHA